MDITTLLQIFQLITLALFWIVLVFLAVFLGALISTAILVKKRLESFFNLFKRKNSNR